MSTTRASSYDVVVVGARVAGASTAMLLARAGLRVLVVDKARAGTDTLSTHALMRGGVLQLHRWGVLDAVVAAGTPAVRHTVFHIDEERTDISIRPAYGVDALYAPRRFILDRLLSEAALEAGADVRYGVHATGLVWRDRRVTGVVLREPGGAERVVHADLVIGADGARSRVAAWVQARLLRTASATAAGVYGYFRG